MAEYAERLAKLSLFRELETSAGRDDASRGFVRKLAGMVLDVADTVGPLLAQVPLTFAQYTSHDITHSCNVINLMGKFIPGKTRKRLNCVELTLLLLSGLLHDLGMVVTDAEKEEFLKSPAFETFRSTHLDQQQAVRRALDQGEMHRARMIEDAMLAEFFRKVHSERFGEAITRILPGKLRFGDADLSSEVARLCESHAWGVRESTDSRDTEKAIVKLPWELLIGDFPVNLRYLACCLRLADILDFDSSRTPLAVFRDKGFTEEKSWKEWMKHLQVRGKRITSSRVTYSCAFSHTALYVAANGYLDAVDAELRDCHYLVEEFPGEIGKRYAWELPQAVDRREVKMANPRHLAGAFRFQLEYDEIMRLLMDKSLYPDPSLFLRELLQNSLDACRHKEARWKEAGKPGSYKPRIVVWDHSDDFENPRIVFQDNGMGMSREIVEDYFMRVGKSYYRSPAFEGERQRLAEKKIDLDACSMFGIGILSCFLAGEKFEVETYRFGHEPLKITVEGPGKYFLIERLDRPAAEEFAEAPKSDEEDGPPNYSGTRVTVYLKPGVKADAFRTLETFAVNVEYEVHVHETGKAKAQVVGARRWNGLQARLIASPGSRSDDDNDADAKCLDKSWCPATFRFMNGSSHVI